MVKVFHLPRIHRHPVSRRQRFAAAPQRRHAQLIGQHLYRLGQVERAEVGMGVDVNQLMATLNFLVGQAMPLTAEQDRDALPRRLRQSTFRRPADIHLRHRQAPQPGAGSQHQGATFQCRFQAVVNGAVLQHIVGAGSTGRGIGMWIDLWRHQVQALQAHDLHRPCSRADVARVGGVDQYNADSRQPLCRPRIASGILCRLCIH